MGERKVLCKYYPPDFNHEKLMKNKRPKDKQDNVRMMLPMSLRCNTCGNYLYIGTKFNMRKETCMNEDYLGIKIFRFYMKCTRCYAEITIKTDPKNSDYIVEQGGTRNYEPWRDAQAAEATLKEIREQEEEGNAMKFLEHKTYDSKKEMDILDALDEIKHMNKRKSQVTHEQLLKSAYDKFAKEDKERIKVDDEDAIVSEIFKNAKIKRLDDNEEEQNDTGNSPNSEDSTRAPSVSTNAVNTNNPQTVEKKSTEKKDIKILIKPIKKMKISEGNDPNLIQVSDKVKVNNETRQNTKPSQPSVVVNSVNAMTSSLMPPAKGGLLNLCNYSDED